MPYFPKLNILLIHIPKTGGTSIEKYFENILKIELYNKYLYSSNNETLFGHSLQHLTYKEIYSIKNILNIDFNNINIITVVRNPYERIISELFFHNMIEINSTKNKVMYEIYKYINSDNNYDNHKIPQYKFLLDNNDKLVSNILVLNTETLTNDMKNLGFKNFNFKELKNKHSDINYYDYLNNTSIDLINNYYDKDFTIFSYDKINITINENMQNMNNNQNIKPNKINIYYIYLLFIVILLIILYIIFKK